MYSNSIILYIPYKCLIILATHNTLHSDHISLIAALCAYCCLLKSPYSEGSIVDDESTIVQLNVAFKAHAERLGIDVMQERDAYISGFVNDTYITASMSSIIKVCAITVHSVLSYQLN